MAKSNTFFSIRHGSTKSHTYQNYYGQQVTKDRVTDVTNPQTTAQMLQRLKMPLVANARKALKGIVNHSFEGVEYGRLSLKEFSSINLKKGAIEIAAYSPKDYGSAYAANFIISKGSLEPIEVEPTDNQNGTAKAGYKVKLAKSLEQTDMPSNEVTENTYSEATVALLSKLFGVASGGQITFLAMRPSYKFTFQAGANEETDLKTGYMPEFLIYRAILQTDEESTVSVKYHDNSGDGGTPNSINIDMGTAIHGNISIGSSELELSIDTKEVELSAITGLCVIKSELDGTQWNRSTQRLVLNTDSSLANEATFNNCVYGYLKSTAKADSTKYLNEGDEDPKV